MLPHPVREACKVIGHFYLHKHKNNYALAADEITKLQITKVEINQNKLCITAGRVGMLIGRRGENIDNLSKFVQSQLQMEIRVIEDEDGLLDCLIPHKEEW